MADPKHEGRDENNDQGGQHQPHHHPRLASTAHAVRLTESWKPGIPRRQSWTPEDRKRDMQMGVMGGRLPDNYSQLSLDLEGAMYRLHTDLTTDLAPLPASPTFPNANVYQLPQGPDWLDWLAKAPVFSTSDLSRRYSSSLSPSVNPLDLGMGLPDIVFGSYDLDGPETPLFDSIVIDNQPNVAKSRGTSATEATPRKKEPSETTSPSTSTGIRYSSRKRKSLASASDSATISISSFAPHSPGAIDGPSPTSPTYRHGTKKTAHNMVEKRYRNSLNDKIAALQDVVPSLRVTAHRLEQGLNPGETTENQGDGVPVDELGGLAPAKKLNKATILSKAAEYILFLERKNEQLMEENEILERGRTGGWR
ncbi:uncharacterized protein DNG_09619 [Cephalotrichum gorgonifer]|uniref:BHLH domain-containing protein n=1 Tax=Cephalotrichum gorgonifer TaxID=2041049 RepID=A0AAE8N8M4_9PEZI|nr:uncharacterized protein DNG_09619 [Cephalotrichum gorgonifer]